MKSKQFIYDKEKESAIANLEEAVSLSSEKWYNAINTISREDFPGERENADINFLLEEYFYIKCGFCYNLKGHVNLKLGCDNICPVGEYCIEVHRRIEGIEQDFLLERINVDKRLKKLKGLAKEVLDYLEIIKKRRG